MIQLVDFSSKEKPNRNIFWFPDENIIYEDENTYSLWTK
jgi:hypothetical protein